MGRAACRRNDEARRKCRLPSGLATDGADQQDLPLSGQVRSLAEELASSGRELTFVETNILRLFPDLALKYVRARVDWDQMACTEGPFVELSEIDNELFQEIVEFAIENGALPCEVLKWLAAYRTRAA